MSEEEIKNEINALFEEGDSNKIGKYHDFIAAEQKRMLDTNDVDTLTGSEYKVNALKIKLFNQKIMEGRKKGGRKRTRRKKRRRKSTKKKRRRKRKRTKKKRRRRRR